MRSLTVVVALVTVAGLLSVSPGARHAVAQTAGAVRVYGSISVNGGNAAAGSGVAAYNGGTACGATAGSGAYDGTWYFLDLDPTLPGCTDPATMLAFTVNGAPANERARPPADGSVLLEVDLTVAGAATSTATPPGGSSSPGASSAAAPAVSYACGPCTLTSLVGLATQAADLPRDYVEQTQEANFDYVNAAIALHELWITPAENNPNVELYLATFGTLADARAALRGEELADQNAALPNSFQELPPSKVGDEDRTFRYDARFANGDVNTFYDVAFYRNGVYAIVITNYLQGNGSALEAVRVARLIDGRIQGVPR